MSLTETLCWQRRWCANCWIFLSFSAGNIRCSVTVSTRNPKNSILCCGISTEFAWLTTSPRASNSCEIKGMNCISSSFPCCSIKRSSRYITRRIPICLRAPTTGFITFEETLGLMSVQMGDTGIVFPLKLEVLALLVNSTQSKIWSLWNNKHYAITVKLATFKHFLHKATISQSIRFTPHLWPVVFILLLNRAVPPNCA